MLLIIVFLLVVWGWTLLAYKGAFIARDKGRSMRKFFWLGIFFPLVTYVVARSMQPVGDTANDAA